MGWLWAGIRYIHVDNPARRCFSFIIMLLAGGIFIIILWQILATKSTSPSRICQE